ncbi:MAG: J domain-containing protein [Acidimicrobiia bacterium]
MTDYYEVLGVARNATDDEIKRAYRAMARQHHPDSNPNDPEAEGRFKEITVAYEVLKDPERRRRYDVFGEDGGRARGPGGPGAGGPGPGDAFGFGDIFDAFFGGDPFGNRGNAGPARAPDAEVVVNLDLARAAFGTTSTVEVRIPVACDRCDGSGCEPGTHPSRCDVCGGAGEVREVRRSILGQIVTAAPCVACSATGSRIPTPCRDCRGDGRVRATRAIDVEVPAGVDDGQRLRLAGRGPAAPRGGVAGDLYVTLQVAPDPRFERLGEDLLHVRRISFAQAALGCHLDVETLEEPEELIVAPGTQPGHVFRLKGRGVPALRGRGRGDLLVRVDVDVPARLTGEEDALLRQWAEMRGEDVAASQDKGVFSRLKSAFQ